MSPMILTLGFGVMQIAGLALGVHALLKNKWGLGLVGLTLFLVGGAGVGWGAFRMTKSSASQTEAAR